MQPKKKKFRLLGMKPKELVHTGVIIGACITGWQYLDNKFDSIDLRFERIDHHFEKIEARLDGIDQRLDKIETDLNKTSTLVDAYLTWRFIYVNDPARKHLIPMYDPKTRTLEFVSPK